MVPSLSLLPQIEIVKAKRFGPRERRPAGAVPGSISVFHASFFAEAIAGGRFWRLPHSPCSPPVISLLCANYLPVTVPFGRGGHSHANSWNPRSFRDQNGSQAGDSPRFFPDNRENPRSSGSASAPGPCSFAGRKLRKYIILPVAREHVIPRPAAAACPRCGPRTAAAVSPAVQRVARAPPRIRRKGRAPSGQRRPPPS